MRCSLTRQFDVLIGGPVVPHPPPWLATVKCWLSGFLHVRTFMPPATRSVRLDDKIWLKVLFVDLL